MKNMLALAGAFTLVMVILLLWMDNALANHLEKQAVSEVERVETAPTKAPQPEIILRDRSGKIIPLSLPEVVIIGRRWKDA